MIFVECNADETLVRQVTRISGREIHHAAGKGEVCNRLSKRQDCIGLVDEDPGSSQPRYIERCTVLEDLSREGLKVLQDQPNSNRLVVIRPKLEEWVLQAAHLSGLDMGKYSLPDNPRELHQAINANLAKFERVLRDLNEARSERIRELRRLLQ